MKEKAPHASELLLRRLAGTITDEEQRQLEAWINESDENRRLAEELTDAAQLTGALRRRSMIETQRPLHDMERRIGRHRRPLLYRRGAWAAAACLALLCLAGGALWLAQGEAPVPMAQAEGAPDSAATLADATPAPHEAPQSADSTATGQESAAQAATESRPRPQRAAEQVRTSAADTPRMAHAPATPKRQPLDLSVPRGNEFHIVLEDSTEVWLNAESRLYCDADFGEKERRVTVQGEAYFKVKKESDRPFLVETDGQTVRVYGTEFNVRSYSDDKTVRTTLVSGAVSLSRKEATGELVLQPGHQATLQKGEGATTVRAVDAEVVTCWRHDRFVLHDQPLEVIMADLARWYDFEYRFESPQLRDIVFMGSIPRYSSLATTLAILERSGGIAFKTEEDNVIVTKR